MTAKIATVLLLIALAGCGGGGGDDEATPTPIPSVVSGSPAGVYLGTTSTGRTAYAVVQEGGEFWLLYSQVGNPTLIVGAEQGTITASNGAMASNSILDVSITSAALSRGTMSGTYSPGKSAAGTVTFPTQTIGFTATYDSRSATTATVANVVGRFAGTAVSAGGSSSSTLTVDSIGDFAGLAGLCNFSGKVTPITGLNAYRITATFGNSGSCAMPNQSVTGVAYYDPATRRIYSGGLNGPKTNGFIFAGVKQ